VTGCTVTLVSPENGLFFVQYRYGCLIVGVIHKGRVDHQGRLQVILPLTDDVFATKPGFSVFCVCCFCDMNYFSYGCMLIFVIFDLVLSYGVMVVSPVVGANLNEPLDPFPFWGGC